MVPAMLPTCPSVTGRSGFVEFTVTACDAGASVPSVTVMVYGPAVRSSRVASPDESVVAESAATAPGPLLGTSTTVAPCTGPDPLLTVASNESAPAWRVDTVVGEPSV